MPTLILLDVSLSMFRPVPTNDNTETHTRLSLACVAINHFLDYLNLQAKLEYVALMSFSSSYEVLVPFTRETDSIRTKLTSLEEGDKTSLENAFVGANQAILGEWGHQTPVQMLLITDGSIGTGPIGRSKAIQDLPLPPSFPARVHVFPIASAQDPNMQCSMPLYQKIVDLASNTAVNNIQMSRGAIYCLDQLSVSGVTAAMTRLTEQNYAPYITTIKCGSLEARARLCPPPVTAQPMDKVINIIGFLSTQDMGSPITYSRHLIIPLPPTTTPAPRDNFDKNNAKDGSNSEGGDEDASDVSKIPNFCVLLHGALKVESMCGVVCLGAGWWGSVCAWCEGGARPRRSTLLLRVWAPGADAAPWLGPLWALGPLGNTPGDTFPIKAVRSYAAPAGGAWSRPPGLLADVQKVLRHSRKLPDKTSHLYKELNRLRRAALALGFSTLISSVAAALERECVSATGGPERAQLAHAAAALRDPRATLDPHYVIHPRA